MAWMVDTAARRRWLDRTISCGLAYHKGCSGTGTTRDGLAVPCACPCHTDAPDAAPDDDLRAALRMIRERHREAYPGAGWCAEHNGSPHEHWPCQDYLDADAALGGER